MPATLAWCVTGFCCGISRNSVPAALSKSTMPLNNVPQCTSGVVTRLVAFKSAAWTYVPAVIDVAAAIVVPAVIAPYTVALRPTCRLTPTVVLKVEYRFAFALISVPPVITPAAVIGPLDVIEIVPSTVCPVTPAAAVISLPLDISPLVVNVILVKLFPQFTVPTSDDCPPTSRSVSTIRSFPICASAIVFNEFPVMVVEATIDEQFKASMTTFARYDCEATVRVPEINTAPLQSRDAHVMVPVITPLRIVCPKTVKVLRTRFTGIATCAPPLGWCSSGRSPTSLRSR